MVSTRVSIFGREPAVIVGFIEAALAVLLSFGLLKFVGIDGAEDVATVMAVVSAVLGVYVAYVTRDALLGYVITAFKSGAALAAAYGFNLSEQQTAASIAVLVALFALFQRTQTGPAVFPSLKPDDNV